MKPARIALCLAVSGLFSACSHVATKEDRAHGASPDYGNTTTTRVFSTPATKAPTQAPPSTNGGDVVKRATDEITAAKPKPGDDDVVALLKLCESQLEKTRYLFDAASKNPQSTGEELFNVYQRLDGIEDRMVTASAAIVQVSFPTGSTALKPSAEIAQVLIAAGKAANVVNVRGRTDSKVAGALYAKIALGRAMAARKFLIDHGISTDKIKVSSQADGDFAATNNTTQGRAFNRRVEFEFVNTRIAELKGQPVKLATSTAR
ncbi:OmpA family protein [Verminephrobacter aporrectodeae subsp. tuberculatae]|uniref:OmpA family protein n=1 Tax=Verminephrobacter aporrectodeae TaxID=1110389 RepID=UPI0009D92BDA|nr:OmpA family protein [Verminephrobacter aporrectodeae]MCW8167040.1 OmpA family protein [Verminephrobacter aporrectodeae subsp. tuberculatae]MCW8171187.1 OmpA family protein [Verminephrobacter aporrectodeae subsp. tuberculatae]MCW8208092.1 OmpA family protein [Verminephrobacter aporrectodeae subsp. tuberculatae]